MKLLQKEGGAEVDAKRQKSPSQNKVVPEESSQQSSHGN